MQVAIEVCNRAAPEHLEIHTVDAQAVAGQLEHYGGLFIGANCAEVVGDYGAGPNHTLPTGGTARSSAGLSVFTFLRIRTFIRIDQLDQAQGLMRDAAALGRIEGLKGHARAAELRITGAGQEPAAKKHKPGDI
eukprot:TRINITY_DN4882_c0_g1_i1.p2 TRINITY_DN4882_c0_g1~~TRINITY_DN4882_c0_g1_i1.p2  ORF type:complete len:134 (-),score=32.69 TRINITY_DN4882_c0_g1_i1:300-701(-)